KWIGAALLPQAGVAMGMALIAADSFPSLGNEILAITVGTTVIFELVGPIATQWTLANVDRDTDKTSRQTSPQSSEPK
ncbi:MAG: hypothetical protein K8F25_18020, partial [Fimbriimonadaceae bacterium]|nr:hypothetical protein [Alphaproteobacteria bacterium]